MAVRNRAVKFELAHPNAAGIDIGSASHFVGVPPDRDDQPVREFKSFIEDLERLADWLEACGVDTVAMESTGGYWIPLFEQEIAMSLRGNWRVEHLFALQQAMMWYDVYGEHLVQCDQQLESMLTALQRHPADPDPARRRSRAKNAPRFGVRTHLFRVCGVDLTRIDGIDITTALKVITEVGPDLSRFKSAKHFASWLGLYPGTKISRSKLLSGASKRTTNRAAQALRFAAAALRTSQSALGAYHRRLCARLDRPRPSPPPRTSWPA